MIRKKTKECIKRIKSIFAFAIVISLGINLAFVEVKVQAEESLPSKYDGREFQTPVKDQGRSELCWAYSTIAGLEANAVKKLGANRETLDLSEYHLAYYTFAERNDPLGLTNSDIVEFKENGRNFINNGGNPSYPLATLTAGMGPVYESDAPMSTLLNEDGSVKANAHTIPMDEALRRGKNAYEVENVYTFFMNDPDSASRDKLKRAIQEYGAAVTAYYSHCLGNYNRTSDEEIAYYQNTMPTFDHGIAIVGWDDNFSKNNFKSGTRPTNNGAWLVKNSWGQAGDRSGYTKDGYFWLSYEDASFTPTYKGGTKNFAYVYELRRANQYKHNYQYDGGLIQEFARTSITTPENLGFANVFTSKGNQRLDAITFLTDQGNAEARLTLKIYKNVNNTPVDGELVHEQPVTIYGNGFFTIRLSDSVNIDFNQKFSVVLLNPDQSTSWWLTTNVATDRDYNPDGSSFRVYNNTEPKQSFVLSEFSNSWVDLDTEAFGGGQDGVSLCIKALMNNQTEETQNPNEEDNEEGKCINHKYGKDWEYDDEEHWHECEICGDKKDNGAHKLNISNSKATFTEDGYLFNSCLICGMEEEIDTYYAASNIKLSNSNFTYTGKTVKPSVIVKNSEGDKLSSKDYKITYPKNSKNIGKYTIKVTLRGNYKGEKSLTYNINPPKSSIKKVQGKSKAIVVSFKKTSQISGYEIQYSNNADFKSGAKKYTIKSARTTKATIKKLKGKKKYYVRIRTYKSINGKKFYSVWSAKKSVTTKK